MARIVSRAMTFAPIAAWIGTSNIWRGISSLSFAVSARPTAGAFSQWTIIERASTGSPLTRTSSLTRRAAR